jgi:succinyl-CoA synthetase beta subunit/citryl-CoA synthetase large subunit
VLDAAAGGPVALASVHGGTAVEGEVAAGRAAVARRPLDPWGRIQPYELRALWVEAGLTGPTLAPVAAFSTAVARAALALDATLLEINPLAVGPDGPVAVGALLEVDDDARDRQPWLPAADGWSPAAWRPATARELAAKASADADPYRGTARFVELDGDGDVGLVTGGGGASLVIFDAVRRAGGSPAAYTEVGGNPSAAKVQGLTAAVLDCPGVRGLLVAHNLTSNTQVDLVAEGVVAALRQRGIDPATFPVVAREVGTHDRVGRETLRAAGVETLGEDVGLEAAAVRIVERIRRAAA